MPTKKNVEDNIKRISAPDKIEVYKSKGEWRWTRKTRTNRKIVAASSEGYSRTKGAIKNIERTQRQPYDVVIIEEE